MKSKYIKHIFSPLAISLISIGATAGLSLPASARTTDVVAPTFVVTGVICGQSGNTLATLLPGQSLTGDVVITSSPGSVTMADSNGSAQTFLATNPPSPQPFTFINTAMSPDTIFACNSSPSLASVINSKVLVTATGESANGGGPRAPINIVIDAHANNNNTNTNNINVSNLLRNLIGHNGYGNNNGYGNRHYKHHHYKRHHDNDDQPGDQSNNHANNQSSDHANNQSSDHTGNQSSDHAGNQSNNHAGNQYRSHSGNQFKNRSGNQFKIRSGNQSR
ncbi:hypothetical protein [Dictyobacter alpinus]|uniref:hypothetical protein n=1 Tax=Dictyobacter alpinus TaxID=2014873 RepID=UPI000F83DE8A|nr:hypothetical protein [Dictyobacter alpinus]